jgi:hypothetical protein
MNTNVGDMPLDIFCDYILDVLNEEWIWEYFLTFNFVATPVNWNFGNSSLFKGIISRNFGDGSDYDYTTWSGTAHGDPFQNYGTGAAQGSGFFGNGFCDSKTNI